MPNRLVFLLSASAVTGLAVLGAASRPAAVTATWRATPIVVDGDDGDWTMPAGSIPKTPLFASVVNDATHVYLRLRTADPAGRLQVLRGGLIVSFDAKGGDKRSLAIKYPVGTPPPLPDERQRDRRPPEGEPRERSKPRDPSQMPDIATTVPNRLEVYGPGKDDAWSMVLDQATGIEVKIARQQDSVVYELKLPLVKDEAHPYAVGARPGTMIGLGVESPKWEGFSRQMPGGPGGGMGGRPGGGTGGGPPGGMGGRGGPGGGAGRPEGGEVSPPKPWKTWTTVQLAREP